MATFYLIIYNILLAVFLIPAFVFVLAFSGKYRKEVFYKISERFAKWNYTLNSASKKTVWIHCSSLGEVRAVEPVLDKLKNDYGIVLTTITKTGRDYAEKIQKADFTALLPIDLYPFMNKIFNIVKPDLLILVETELWASMLYSAGKKNIKVVTVNGRMSAKSFKVYGALKFFWKHFVGSINMILARSREDAGRFIALSGKNADVSVSGNIKYDRDFSVKSFRSDFGLVRDDKVFTAGSIRAEEDKIIADAYLKIKIEIPEIYFFAAPRHLSKLSSVRKTLEDKKIKYSLFSALEPGKKTESRFILVDVFGKLQSIYAVSDICFVGGSIVNKGGQNPIEPAASGKPVLFGKNMYNFKTETEILLKYGGGITVSDAGDIAAKTGELFSNEALRISTGENALKAVKSQKGAVEITVNKIKEML
jgi:3-deoxy-D-manno-octulosonic-acid transferase